MKPKIGIIGVGIVGGAVESYYKNEGYEVIVYDKFKERGSVDAVNSRDFIFCCLPTPHIGGSEGLGYDLSAYKEILPQIKDGKTVIIKSTVLPGTTDEFQQKYPKLKLKHTADSV